MINFGDVFVIWALVLALIVSCGVSIYLWGQSRKLKGDVDIKPLDNGLIVYFVYLSIFFVLIGFIYLNESGVSVRDNIGQVGDFIGGLLNPILSFMALLVLLRNSVIQSSETRRNAEFLKEQTEIARYEKFESTFFELLRHAETYADAHMRTPDEKGKTRAAKLCDRIHNATSLSSGMSPTRQMKFALDFVENELFDDINDTFFERFVRVIRFVNSSKIDDRLKSSYMSMISNTLYVDERLVFSHMSIRYAPIRKHLRRWRLVRIRDEYFICPIFARYFSRFEVNLFRYRA